MPNPRSPKFPNFLEHHKPFPSNKRGAHRAGCVNRNTYKPIVHYMKKIKRKGANNLLSNDYVFKAQSFNFVTNENL